MKVTIIPMGTSQLPKRAYDNDAGADVFVPEDTLIEGRGITVIPLGFGLEIPDGYAGFIFPRSGLSRAGIICQLPPIDSSYRGEVHAIVLNAWDTDYEAKAGDRIGQLVIMPVVIADFVEAKRLRGDAAFGSTGR